jgi:spermidine/putrescine transport system substrate-binding protein
MTSPARNASSTTARLASAVTRRRFLQGSALVGFSAFLAACTSSGGASQPPASIAIPTVPPESEAANASPTPKPSPTGPLQFANWEAYIDQTKAADAKSGVLPAGSSPTIENFKKKYGVDVNYVEKINDNEEFYALIQPALSTGLTTGWDLIVMTDWMAARLISKGWIEKIDPSSVPNCTANLRDALRNQPWDPGNDYHYPWQSGMTGIGYDKKALQAAGKPAPKSIADLYTLPPNKITFLTESRDTFGLGLLKLGKNADPATTTDDDLQAVHDDLQPIVTAGARFTGNDYLADFASRKVWAAMVWSGDLASSADPSQVFVFPTEGVMVWTDNMMIPKGATNKYTAELMMNYVYDPKVAAQIEAYVYYVCPVKGADVEIAKLDSSAPSNPLIFPTADIVAKQHNFQFLSDELDAKLKELYLDLTNQ